MIQRTRFLYKAEFLLTKFEDGREIDYVQSVPDSLQAENSRLKAL